MSTSRIMSFSRRLLRKEPGTALAELGQIILGLGLILVAFRVLLWIRTGL